MNAVKGVQADLKEKIHNVQAKLDEKAALSKASAAAKAERKEAVNKAGKHEAKANYHGKQAEILREYEQKVANNAAEKEQTKTALQQKKVDKHTNKADKHANAKDGIVGDGKPDSNFEQTTTAPVPSDAEGQASHAQEEGMTGTNTRDAAAPGDTTQEQLAQDYTREGDINATNTGDAAGSDPVHHSQIPMHGSGVPTHSTLHRDGNGDNDTHDPNTTQTMGGSPNTGSYM